MPFTNPNFNNIGFRALQERGYVSPAGVPSYINTEMPVIQNASNQVPAAAATQVQQEANSSIQNQSNQTLPRPTDFFGDVLNPYGAGDLTSSAANLGRAIGYQPTTGGGGVGRTLSIIGNAGALALRTARATLAGWGTERVNQMERENYAEELRRSQEAVAAYAKNGGKIVPKFPNGGVVVEVEDGEYIRTPEGEVIEVQGNTHEEGGENFNLSIATEITSNNLKIGKSGVNKINELYPNLSLNIKPSDTYADVVTKATNRIGVDKQQEKVDRTITQLENLSREDENTFTTNQIYLNDRLANEESELQILKDSQRTFLDSMFDLQESTKRRPTPNTDTFFKNGGRVKDEYVEQIYSKTRLPREYIRRWLSRRAPQKFPDGGTVTWQRLQNQYALPDYQRQRFTQTGQPVQTSGNVSEDAVNARILESLRIFPASAQFFNITYGDNGAIQDIAFKSDSAVRDYQNYVNRVYDNISSYADDFVTDEAQREELKSYVNGLRFDADNPESVRFTDNIFGDFTSSRSGVALPLVTQTELEALRSQGVNNFSQLFDESGNLTSLPLSDSTRTNLLGIRERYGTDFEAGILGIPEAAPAAPAATPSPQTEAVTPAPNPSEPSTPAGGTNTGDVGEYNNGSGSGNGFNIPIFPNQYRYDYDTLQGTFLQEPRLGRQYARRINTDVVTGAAYNNLDSALRETAGYADPQRLSVVSDAIASSTVALNQAITDIEARNMQNEQAVEQFNIAQGDAEMTGLMNERRIYEQLTMTALAKTEKNNELIDNHNQAVTLTNWNTYNRLRNLNSLTPNFNFSGGTIQYDPTSGVPIVFPGNQGQASYAIQQQQAAAARQQAGTTRRRTNTRG